MRGQSTRLRLLDWVEPKLCHLAVVFSVNVGRLAAIAAREEEAVLPKPYLFTGRKDPQRKQDHEGPGRQWRQHRRPAFGRCEARSSESLVFVPRGECCFRHSFCD